MARIVMKFGGTSMAGIERIRNVAARVKREVDARQPGRGRGLGDGGRDRPAGAFCREASALYDPREYDVVVASGEQVTSGLLAIDAAGDRREGAQLAGLAVADPHLGRPRQGAHRRDRHRTVLDAALAGGEVAVIPGFQGMAETAA